MKIKSFKSNIKFFGVELIATILIAVFMSVAIFYSTNEAVSAVEKLQTECSKHGGQLVEHDIMRPVGKGEVPIPFPSYSCERSPF